MKYKIRSMEYYVELADFKTTSQKNGGRIIRIDQPH